MQSQGLPGWAVGRCWCLPQLDGRPQLSPAAFGAHGGPSASLWHMAFKKGRCTSLQVTPDREGLAELAVGGWLWGRTCVRQAVG